MIVNEHTQVKMIFTCTTLATTLCKIFSKSGEQKTLKPKMNFFNFFCEQKVTMLTPELFTHSSIYYTRDDSGYTFGYSRVTPVYLSRYDVWKNM